MGINLPNGANVEEIVLPNGSQASEVIGPDGSTVWERLAIPDGVHLYDALGLSLSNGDTIDPFPDSAGANDLAATGSPEYETTTNIGEPAAFYDGTDDEHRNASWGGSAGDELTIGFVAEPLSTSGRHVLAHIGNGDNNIMLRVVDGSWQAVTAGTGDLSGGSASTNSTYVGVATTDGSNTVLQIGDTDVIDGSLAAASRDPNVVLGNDINGGDEGNWHIHEIRPDDVFADAARRDEIIDGLESKWGFTSASP